jgi:primosomal protein N' (replication factor Y) (superfamily II helicase)
MIAQVALPLPIDRTFSYMVPNPIAPLARPLCRVKVPFNNRFLTGFIVAVDDEGEEDGLKPVRQLLDPVPMIDNACFRLCEWSSRHYVAPIGLVLKYALSSAIKIENYCVVRTDDPLFLSLENMLLKKAYAALGREAVFDSLNRGTMRLYDVFTDTVIEPEEPKRQRAGYRPEVRLGGVQDRLEYYIPLMSDQLEQGKNVLMLLPDRYAVGDFFYRSLASRFSGVVFWYGSSMSEKKKAEVYFKARNGRGQLILGSKSCVFLPLRDLGLVIAERPEEDEYRNEDAFKFNAVRLAVKRAEIESVPLVLGSVSPPVEIMKWVEEGTVAFSRGRPVEGPMVSSIRSEKDRGRGIGLPGTVVAAIHEAIDRGGNVFIHTPRRAYAANLNCSVCGRSLICARCGGFAVSYNKSDDLLTCGTCKSDFPYEETCPSCHSPYIRFFGVGAEYLEATLTEEFPGTAVIRVTGERDRKSRKPLLGSSSERQGVIVVGTHVLSKLYGLKADELILHGWGDMLRSGGYRAREKMFQVFTNLLDALRPDRLLVCTSGKEPLDISLFLDAARFYADELEKRKMADFPPYERFFLISILKRSEPAGNRVIKAIERLVAGENLEQRMLGPIKVKGQYSWRVVLKGDSEALFPLLSSLSHLSGVHVEADPFYV